jgi:hypothetical protein
MYLHLSVFALSPLSGQLFFLFSWSWHKSISPTVFPISVFNLTLNSINFLEAREMQTSGHVLGVVVCCFQPLENFHE